MINLSSEVEVNGKEYKNIKDAMVGKALIDCVTTKFHNKHVIFNFFDVEVDMFIKDAKDLEKICRSNGFLITANDPDFNVEKSVFLTTPEKLKEDADNSNWCVGCGWAVPYSYSSEDKRIIYFINVAEGGSEFWVVFRDCDGFMKGWDVISADRMSLERIFEFINKLIKDDKAEQKTYKIKSYYENYQIHSIPAKDLESALKQLERGPLSFKVVEKDYVSDSFEVDQMTLEANYEEEFEEMKKNGKIERFDFEIK